MKKTAATSLIVLVLLLGGVLQNLKVAMGQTENVNYVIKMSVTYSNPSDGALTWNFTEEDRAISLFMNSTWQTVELTNSTLSIEAKKSDDDGNPIAVLKFQATQLSPGENITFTSTYHVVSKPRPLPQITEIWSGTLQNIPADLREEYTKGEGPWLTGNSTLQSLAHNIVGAVENETKVLTLVRKLVVWIHNRIAYPDPMHEFPLYANETINEGRGDCDDQAILLITLSRILGIPAYLQVGAIYMPTMTNDTSTYWQGHVKEVAKKIGWHGWAMVYVPPWGWLPVDLTFVWGGGTDPIKAITNAAVTSQNVIQYMNVTKSDYVASSRQAREFLINNDFYVYMEDEMTAETSAQDGFGEGFREWLIVVLIIAGGILVASSLIITRRFKRGTGEEFPKPQELQRPIRAV